MNRYTVERMVTSSPFCPDCGFKPDIKDVYKVEDRKLGEVVCECPTMDKALKIAGMLNNDAGEVITGKTFYVPLSIGSDEEYQRVIKEFEALMEANPSADSPEGSKLIRIATVLEKYEEKRWPMSSGGGSGVAALEQLAPDPQ